MHSISVVALVFACLGVAIADELTALCDHSGHCSGDFRSAQDVQLLENAHAKWQKISGQLYDFSVKSALQESQLMTLYESNAFVTMISTYMLEILNANIDLVDQILNQLNTTLTMWTPFINCVAEETGTTVPMLAFQ